MNSLLFWSLFSSFILLRHSALAYSSNQTTFGGSATYGLDDFIIGCKQDEISHNSLDGHGDRESIMMFLDFTQVAYELVRISNAYFLLVKNEEKPFKYVEQAIKIVDEAFDNINYTKNGIVSINSENYLWNKDRIDQKNRLKPDSRDFNFRSSFTGKGVTIYVIDTGINLRHEDFGGRAIFGRNFVGEANGDQDDDRNGHGTHCAGIAGGERYGIAKDARLVAVKALSQNGSGSYISLIRSLSWTVMHAKGVASVISVSLGTLFNPILNMAVEAAGSSMIVVSVAGNNANDACFFSPSSVGGVRGKNGVIIVGATNIYDTRPYWSNYGKCVDIWAPGESIRSSYIGSETASEILSGTSMACPAVAGVAATLLEKNEFNMREAIRELFASSVKRKLKAIMGSPNRFLQTVRSKRRTKSNPKKTPAPTPFPTYGPEVLCINNFCPKIAVSFFGPFYMDRSLKGVIRFTRKKFCSPSSHQFKNSFLLIYRAGSKCSGLEQVYFAEKSGAKAVIIIQQRNRKLESLRRSSPNTMINIPSMMITYKVGQRIKARYLGRLAVFGPAQLL